MKKILIRQILFFFTFSGLAAIINIGSRFYLSKNLSIDYTSAVTIAYFLGMVANYLLNKFFNFPQGSRNAIKEMRTFIVVAIVGLGITIILSNLLIFFIEEWKTNTIPDKDIKTAAHIGAVGLTAVYSFLCHKYLTYQGGIRFGIRRVLYGHAKVLSLSKDNSK